MLATPPPAVYAPLHAGGTIKAYAGWTAWQDVDAQAGEYVVKVRSPSGTVTTRPEHADIDDLDDPQPNGLPFDLGPDARGRPSIVLGQCGRLGRLKCHVAIGRLPARASRPVGGTAQAQMPLTVTVWRTRLAWADGDDVGTLHLRRAPGAPARPFAPWSQKRPYTEQAELHGDLLAATLNYDDRTAPEDNAIALALANVRTGHAETLATVQPGEGGQRFTGASFLGGHTLSWLMTCLGDDGGCNPRFGVYRRDLRTRRTVFARDARQHFGFTALSDTTVLLGPSQYACLDEGGKDMSGCRIQRRRLTFGPAPR